MLIKMITNTLLIRKLLTLHDNNTLWTNDNMLLSQVYISQDNNIYIIKELFSNANIS